MAYQYTIDFNQAPEKVFRYLDDEELVKQWLSGLVSIEAISEGGNRVGAKAKHIYHENGQNIEMLEEMLIYVPNQHVKIRGVTDGFEMTAEYRLEAIPQGTRLHFAESLTMHNWFMRLLSPIIQCSSQARLKANLEKLKALVEA
jgi:uncharacterized protein YndB with AHSA1/START domain